MAEKPRIHLEPGKYYHLFNRGINRATLFHDADDFEKFLVLAEHHLCPIGRVYAYALLRDHWHLCISTLPATQLPPHRLKDKHALGRVVGHLQNAYAKYFNHKNRRVSGLFEHKYERTEVSSLQYFKTLIVYLHFNPQKHDFVASYENYRWSSYRTLREDTTKTFLARDLVMSKFGGREAFLIAHENYEKSFWDKLAID